MYKLTFIQSNNPNGSCRVLLNNQDIDGCDMNYEKRYTQAHIVLASVYRTLKTLEVDVEIKPVEGSVECGTYPIHLLKSMALMLIDRSTFNDNFGYTRIYPVKLVVN
jgi:hypothetical protein